MTWRTPLGALVAAFVLAGCGGSSSTSSSTTTTASSSATSSSAPATSTTSGTTSSRSAVTSTRSTTSVSAPELPANFTIAAGGRLSPPSVGAPAHTDVALTVDNHDSRSHGVEIATKPAHALTVPAGASRSILLTHLPNGQYPIKVDGVTQGRLIVGITPGP